MKKSLKILLVLILIVAVVVGGYFGYLQLMKKSVTETIDKMFLALRTGDENQIKEFINIEDGITDNDEQTEGAEMERIMMKNLNYEILSLDCKVNQCTANLKIINKDLNTVFKNYMTKAISLAFAQAMSDTSDSDIENQLKQYFEEQYDSDAVENVSKEITINMKKENGKWNITCDEDALIDAILPGYREFIEYVNSIDSDLDE